MAIHLHKAMQPMIGIRQLPEFLRLSAAGGTSIGLPWSFTERLSARNKPAASKTVSGRCSCALTPAAYGEAYNEEAFHFLLSIERKRFERSHRPFVLALIELESRPGQPERMDPAISGCVFDGLTRSLRETDVVGWYRDGRIVGAMLTHLGDGTPEDVSRELCTRMTQTLRADLPPHAADRLKVQLYQPLETLRS
jgi:hypothetical protein